MKLKHYLIMLLPIVVLLCGCAPIKEIPVQTIEKEIIKDSLIYITDSVLVEVPVEKIVQVLPADTTSKISTSLAVSEAKIEQGKLHHSLQQKGQIKAQIDTVIQVQYVDRIVEREIPITVEVEKPYIPNWCWYLLFLDILLILSFVIKIYLKNKL